MTEFNDLQTIKRTFFAYRNGIIADTLRKAGSPFKIIFGLNMPQLKEIASTTGSNRCLAEKLWQNSTTRESMLFAPMIYPPREMTEERALEWCSQITATEVAETLVHSLLRKLPFADSLIDQLISSASDMERYTALCLLWSLVGKDNAKVRSLADAELRRDCQSTRNMARRLLDEIDFLEEE